MWVWQDIATPVCGRLQFTEGTPEQQDDVIHILLSLKRFRFAVVIASWSGNSAAKGS
jgi:hypothetical protein